MVKYTNFTRRSFLKLTGTGLVAITAGTQTTVASEQSLRDAARERVGEKTGADPDGLDVVNESMASWSTLGEQYYHAKLRHRDTRELHGVLLDGDENRVNRATLDEREREAYHDRYGKLDTDLHATVEDAAPAETVEVGIWLHGIDYGAARKAVDLDALPTKTERQKRLREEVLDRVEAKTGAFAEDISGRDGVSVLGADRGSTFVEAEVTTEALNAIQQRAEVQKIFPVEREVELDLDDATKTHRTYWDNEGSYTASGYPVGQGETKPDSTAYVNIGGTNWTGDYGGSDDTSGHSQMVMEVMASKDDDHPGTGHNADVYHADEILKKFDSKMQWFEDNFVCAINFSWSLGSRDRTMSGWDFRFDQQAYHRYLNLIKSAGNNSDSDDDGTTDKFDTRTPGLGFNTVSVGNVDNKNNSNWSDDEIAGSSSYESPKSRNSSSYGYPHTKPEVSAVGVGTDLPSGGTGGGTSAATPGVTGMYAVLSRLCDDYSVYDVRFYPAVAKSIIMACARNDAGSFDNKMGAGTISAYAAEDIISNETYLDDDFSKSNDAQTYSNYFSSGSEVRLALVWLSNVGNSDFSDNADAQSDLDLDLAVYDPDGSHVTSSNNFDRGFEFLNFSTTSSGTYEFRVNNYRWDAAETSRNIGLAWHVQ